MDDTIRLPRRSLASRLEALETAARELGRDRPEAIAAARRLATSLRSTGDQAIARAAIELAAAPDVEMSSRLSGLIEVLQRNGGRQGSERHTILVIDDDPMTGMILQARLAAPNRRVQVCTTAAEAEDAIRAEQVSLVLLDLLLPDMDGRQLLVRLRDNRRTAGIPVIVLSAKAGTLAKAECFALGCEGYFEKPLDLDAVGAAISARLDQSRDLHRELQRDPVTGLPNRSAFQDFYDQARALSRRRGYPLSLAVIDLDQLKWVNDTLGHGTGDEVIRRIAVEISGALRDSDIVVRWGGDEFVALLHGASQEEAAKVLRKALTALERQPIHTPEGPAVRLTFSAGVAEVAEGASLEHTFARADQYLYLAKAAGGGRVVVADDSMPPPRHRILLAEDDHTVASTIRRRLAHEGFEVAHHENGWLALEAARRGAASLVIADLDMPVLDGFELLRELRRMPSFARVPVLMVTGMGEDRRIVKAFELGADDYVLKPFSSPELVARVRRLLRKR